MGCVTIKIKKIKKQVWDEKIKWKMEGKKKFVLFAHEARECKEESIINKCVRVIMLIWVCVYVWGEDEVCVYQMMHLFARLCLIILCVNVRAIFIIFICVLMILFYINIQLVGIYVIINHLNDKFHGQL